MTILPVISGLACALSPDRPQEGKRRGNRVLQFQVEIGAKMNERVRQGAEPSGRKDPRSPQEESAVEWPWQVSFQELGATLARELRHSSSRREGNPPVSQLSVLNEPCVCYFYFGWSTKAVWDGKASSACG